MTKPIDPEIKALRALVRALDGLDDDAKVRCVDWLYACVHNTTQAEVRRRLRAV